MDNLLSVEKTAEVLSISPWTVRAWITKGKLGSTKLGSRRLVPQSEIEKLIAKGTVSAIVGAQTPLSSDPQTER